MRLIKEAFDLESASTDTVRFVPVDLRAADLPTREADLRETLELAPATLAISPVQLLPTP